MQELRDFASFHNLQVKDRTKEGLYEKICKAWDGRESKQVSKPGNFTSDKFQGPSFDELSETSPMQALRDFVSFHGLDVADKSKVGLYKKICEAWLKIGAEPVSEKREDKHQSSSDEESQPVLSFKNLHETSSMQELRDFVEFFNLGVTDRSQSGLYRKLCVAWKQRTVAPISGTFDDNKPSLEEKEFVLSFDELSEASPIKDLRDFAIYYNLNVADRSKVRLYEKICEAWETNGPEVPVPPVRPSEPKTEINDFPVLPGLVTERSTISELRDFVDEHNLGVTAKSRAELYRKILLAWAERDIFFNPKSDASAFLVATSSEKSRALSAARHGIVVRDEYCELTSAEDVKNFRDTLQCLGVSVFQATISTFQENERSPNAVESCEKLSATTFLNIFNEMIQDRSKSYFFLYYSGHGDEDGNFVMDDGSKISFDDVVQLWTANLNERRDGHGRRRRRLIIVADCCFSGKWVQKLKQYFKTEPGVSIGIQAACREDEYSIDTAFTKEFGQKIAEGTNFKWKKREEPKDAADAFPPQHPTFFSTWGQKANRFVCYSDDEESTLNSFRFFERNKSGPKT